MPKSYKSIITLFSFALALQVSGCASNSKMVSASDQPGKTKIVYAIEINAAKEKTWKVLADFADLSWSETVKDVHFLNAKRSEVGMARHCDLKNDGYIVERITQWNEGSDFTYVIEDASDPIVPGSFAIWRVEGDDNNSKVTFEVHYELKYGVIGDLMNVAFAKKKFLDQITGFMGELKTHVEKTNET